MRLREYLIEHYLPERPGISSDYCRLLASTVRGLCQWAGRKLTIEEIDRPLLAEWVREQPSCMKAAGRRGGRHRF